MNHKTFSKSQLETMCITKGELRNLIGLSEISTDCALPQTWLTTFTDETGLSYDLVRSTCFTVYNEYGCMMEIVSGCTEVQAKIN